MGKSERETLLEKALDEMHRKYDAANVDRENLAAKVRTLEDRLKSLCYHVDRALRDTGVRAVIALVDTLK